MSKHEGKAWHLEMRPRACAYAFGKCQRCGKTAEGYDGVIHHLSYPAGCYKRTVEDLIREGICQWLCRNCHNAIHITESWEEAQTDKMKRGAHCTICGELTFGVWDRAKTLGINHAICKKCMRRQRRETSEDQSGQLKLL